MTVQTSFWTGLQKTKKINLWLMADLIFLIDLLELTTWLKKHTSWPNQLGLSKNLNPSLICPKIAFKKRVLTAILQEVCVKNKIKLMRLKQKLYSMGHNNLELLTSIVSFNFAVLFKEKLIDTVSKNLVKKTSIPYSLKWKISIHCWMNLKQSQFWNHSMPVKFLNTMKRFRT